MGVMRFFYPEGATPIDDISGLKPPWVKTQKDLNQVEAENISNAVSKYLLKAISPPKKWFNTSTLKKIHYDMFCDVWDWAGEFRNTQTIPGMPSYQIVEALENLCCDVFFWCNESCNLSVIEQAAIIHHRLVFIHPFLNGNGRFSRLVSDRYLKSFKCPFPDWPTDLNKDGRHRKSYIKALQKADQGNIKPLVYYMEENIAFDKSSFLT